MVNDITGAHLGARSPGSPSRGQLLARLAMVVQPGDPGLGGSTGAASPRASLKLVSAHGRRLLSWSRASVATWDRTDRIFDDLVERWSSVVVAIVEAVAKVEVEDPVEDVVLGVQSPRLVDEVAPPSTSSGTATRCSAGRTFRPTSPGAPRAILLTTSVSFHIPKLGGVRLWN
jgi:hypothetical protein